MGWGGVGRDENGRYRMVPGMTKYGMRRGRKLVVSALGGGGGLN